MAFVLNPISGGNPISLEIQTRIGSSQELSNAHVDDSQVLPLHCQVFHGDDGYTIQDLTRAGILVNNEPITQARLNPGDRIQIGKVIYEFTEDAAPFPQPSQDKSHILPNALAAITNVRETGALSPNQTAVPLFGFTLISSGKRFNVSLTSEKNEVLIGRDPEKGSELLFNDGQVSGLHCKIFSEDGVLKIQDLNSSNGTRVNGVRTTDSIELKDKDLVRIGSSIIKVLFSGTPLSNSDTLLENGITINSKELIEGDPGLKFTLLDKECAQGLVTFSIPLKEKIILGREPNCTVRWDFPTVTKKHCTIELIDGKVVIKDNGSRNGTYINDGDEKVHEATLNNKDEIRLGRDNQKFYVEFINILPISTSKSIMDSDSSISSDDSSLYRTIPEPIPSSPKHELIGLVDSPAIKEPEEKPIISPRSTPWWKFW